MADKIARCPASANTSNATLPSSLCSRSIVDDVYTADVPLAFLTVIYAQPPPPPLLRYFVSLSIARSPSSVSTTLVILVRLGFDIARFPPTRATLARSLSVTPRPLGFRHSHIHFSPHCSFRGLSHALCFLTPFLCFSFSFSLFISVHASRSLLLSPAVLVYFDFHHSFTASTLCFSLFAVAPRYCSTAVEFFRHFNTVISSLF